MHSDDGNGRSRWVAPFRNPRITACLPAPLGLSQATTSFIASWRQDIHRVPLVASSPRPRTDRADPPTGVGGLCQISSFAGSTGRGNVSQPPRAASRSTRFRRGKLLKSLTRCTLTIVQQIRYPLVKEHDQPWRFRFDGPPAHRGSPCRDREKAVRAGRSEVGRTVYRPRRACQTSLVVGPDRLARWSRSAGKVITPDHAAVSGRIARGDCS